MLERRRKLDDFTAEIETHLQLEAERLREQGLSAEDARAAAHRTFGNVTRVRERFYESGRWLFWDHLWQDVRFGLGLLRKSPGFTTVAVLTIALGIGATTAIFSVVDATLLHPLPYPHPEQLVGVEDDLPGVGARDVRMSVPEWHDLERSGIFAYISPIGGGDVNLTGSSHPERVSFLAVAPNYFALLGVKPQLGRAFNPGDRTPGFNLEAVISDGLWRRAFAADPRILERSLRLDNDMYRVVGVMPAGFRDPGRTPQQRNTEVWLGSNFGAPPAPPPVRSSRFLLEPIARLEGGLTLAAAQSRLDAVVAALQRQFPGDYPAQSAWTVRLVPLKDRLFADVRQSLVLLLGAVGLVLLIGCVNVANLMLARASARRREMAVRQALGAGRRRLVAQLLTESVLLSLAGGIVGMAILLVSKALLLRLVPDSLPRLHEVSIDWTVLLFALAVSLAAGAAFGLAPALHAGRLSLTHTLKQEGRGATGSGEQARTRRALVVTELALSLVLMIAAGLLLRSFRDLLDVRLGFDPRQVMAVRIWLPIPNDPKTDVYRTAAQEAPFVREVLRRTRALPGVEQAALGDVAAIPLGHDRNDLLPFPLILDGHETPTDQAPLVGRLVVTPEYFHLMGMTLRRGRLFNELDNDKAPTVAVVNEAFARTYFPNADPLGKRLKVPAPGNAFALSWGTVVGVLAEARTESLAQPAVPQVYLALYQRRAKDLAVFMRGRLDTAAIPARLREQVQSIDPELPVYGAQRLDDVVSDSLSARRFSMQMVGLFALTALLLAGLGIYGVISYLVSERTHEIGLRLALGAHRRNVLRIILRQGFGLALAGAAIGLACALVVSHAMAGLLYGVRPTDPLTFVGVAAVLLVVALLACFLPARRAMSIDPMVALRIE
jgi:putative ABC transport system permease protein